MSIHLTISYSESCAPYRYYARYWAARSNRCQKESICTGSSSSIALQGETSNVCDFHRRVVARISPTGSFRKYVVGTLSEALSRLHSRRFLRLWFHLSTFFEFFTYSFAQFQISVTYDVHDVSRQLYHRFSKFDAILLICKGEHVLGANICSIFKELFRNVAAMQNVSEFNRRNANIISFQKRCWKFAQSLLQMFWIVLFKLYVLTPSGGNMSCNGSRRSTWVSQGVHLSWPFWLYY